MNLKFHYLPKLKFISIALATLIPSLCIGGTPDGPYIVYADLSGTGRTSTIIKSYMDSDRKGLFCGDISRSPLIFLKKRPEGMDDQHLRAALVNGDQVGRKKLQNLLLAYRLDSTITQGLDGIIAYVDKPQPRMLSLGVIGPIKATPVRASYQTGVVDAFCDALPDTHRN